LKGEALDHTLCGDLALEDAMNLSYDKLQNDDDDDDEYKF